MNVALCNEVLNLDHKLCQLPNSLEVKNATGLGPYSVCQVSITIGNKCQQTNKWREASTSHRSKLFLSVLSVLQRREKMYNIEVTSLWMIFDK